MSGARTIQPKRIADALLTAADEVDFAFLLGSARAGRVKSGSDVDVAVFVKPGVPVGIELMAKLAGLVEDACGNRAECDLGVLNRAGPIFRFEALRGVRLFVRPERMEEYAAFYSLACREYEDCVEDMRRQRTSNNASENMSGLKGCKSSWPSPSPTK